MSIAVSERAYPAGVQRMATGDSVGGQVQRLLQRQSGDPALLERRRDRRFPFPALMTLWPADRERLETSFVIVGKDLSERGLGFFHQQPILCRRAIVVCEQPGVESLAFLIDINWCRFTCHGWYESGGRLLEAVTPPTLSLEDTVT